MSTHKFTIEQAQNEITYRAIPKGRRPARDFDPGLAFHASGKELAARVAGDKRTRKAPAPAKAPAKVTRTVTPKVTRKELSPAQVKAGQAFEATLKVAGLKAAYKAYAQVMRTHAAA